MAITRERKEELLKKAKEIVGESATTVFVRATGLSAGDTNQMRSAMVGEEVGYAVIKKTLIRKALDEATLEGERPDFEGELALAYGSDLIAPARVVREFQKKHQEKIAILGGIFDGAYMDQAEMTAIAKIPDPQTLRGMFVNIINTPLQQLASTLQAVAEKKEAGA